MIDVIQMPLEATKFNAIQDCISIRKEGRESSSMWIGQSNNPPDGLEEYDRNECYHIMNRDRDGIIGYARLRPVFGSEVPCEVGTRIEEVATQSQRYPAFELQRVSIDAKEIETGDTIGNRGLSTLRELVMEAFRICNINQAKFLYCSCDHGGSKELRRLGIRYSTLSTPFNLSGRLLVLVCISVTNSNFTALNPLRLVGGTEAPTLESPHSSEPEPAARNPSIFDKIEAFAEIVSGTNKPPT